MAKHTWALLNRSQDKAKKMVYKCITCNWTYILKQSDQFSEDTECKFTNNAVWTNESTFNFENFTGIYIYQESIQYYKNGILHRDDGPAVRYTKQVYYDRPINYAEYWLDGKHIEDVESIEEAFIKNLLE